MENELSLQDVQAKADVAKRTIKDALETFASQTGLTPLVEVVITEQFPACGWNPILVEIDVILNVKV